MRTEFLIIAASAILLLQGCSLAPKFSKPKIDLPSQYDNNTIQRQTINVNWWKNFNDNNLDKLIAEVVKDNDNLKLSATRISEAAAYLGLSNSNLYPAGNASLSGYRQKNTNKTLGGYGSVFNSFTIIPSVQYELDLWGKLKNQKKAAYLSLLSSVADREALKLSLISNAAGIYFNLISANNQIQIAKSIAEAFQRIYEYRKNQYKYGDIDEITVEQAKAQYENDQLMVESIKQGKVLLSSALSVLLGRTPRGIFEAKIALNKRLPKATVVPVGLPSSLIENRPDILAAEENLRAKNAMIGVARAAYFPNISLTGLLGYQSRKLSDLISSPSEFWQIGSPVNMSIFDFGRIRANIKISEAEKKAALIGYEKTVRDAFKEVYNALNRLKISREKFNMQKNLTTSLKKVLELSKKRFEYGYSSHIELFDAQIKFLSAKLDLVRSNEEVIADEVLLYKALGGGWSVKQMRNVGKRVVGLVHQK